MDGLVPHNGDITSNQMKNRGPVGDKVDTCSTQFEYSPAQVAPPNVSKCFVDLVLQTQLC